MKKTIQYKKTDINIPSNFKISTTNHNRQAWKEVEDNYFLAELGWANYDINSLFYNSFLESLMKDKKKVNKDVKTYEWKEFLLFIFDIYQRASKQKLLPRERAKAVRAFLEDFRCNVTKLNKIDKKFNLKSKADKTFYLKKDDETYLLGFLVDKKLIITFSYIINHLVDKHSNQFTRPGVSQEHRNSWISNIHDYFLFLLYEKWGAEIVTKTRKKEKVTLGADPEFLIYKPYKKNPKIADYRTLQAASGIISSHSSADELGLDGCTDLGELRPQPSTSPFTLTKNIKSLFNKFYSEHGDNFFIETGGGCNNSIGGHIHIGHELFKNYTNAQIKPLVQLLDAFLYYPIKLNMYGAVREWRDFNELNVEIDYYLGECKVSQDPENIIKIIKKVKPLKRQQFNNFDIKSQCRSQPHGLEYRSLPSFIGDFTFTKLVFKLAKSIAEKYIDLRTQGTQFTYNDPPQKEDYLVFLKEKEVKQLFEYLYGKKKDLFLKNTLKNWKVIKQFFINIQDGGSFLNFTNTNIPHQVIRTELETKFSKNYRSYLVNNNHSLKIHLLASNHYYRTIRFHDILHPTFIMTRHVNFSTLTEAEIRDNMSIPPANTIYIGIPHLWRDKRYIDKKSLSIIIGESIRVFQNYNKKRNSFKYDQSLRDLKRIPKYNNLHLSQIAEEINEYKKVFKKNPPKKKPKRKPIASESPAVSEGESQRAWEMRPSLDESLTHYASRVHRIVTSSNTIADFGGDGGR